MLQILFERQFIDKYEPERYTMTGKKDAYGNIIAGTSLTVLMENCIDFINKETLLQYNARLLGVTVDQSPKCHPEIAGEGVEYSWACSK